MHLSLSELSNVGPIGLDKFALSLSHSEPIAALIATRSLIVGLIPSPMLFIFLPLATIGQPIVRGVCANTVCLTLFPVAVIYVTVFMDQSTLAVGLILSPETLVDGSVGPPLSTSALPGLSTGEPLAFVGFSNITIELYNRSTIQVFI